MVGTSSETHGVGIPGSFGRAFLWEAALGLVDLNQFLPTLGIDLTGWTLTEATGISADGLTIVGNGVNPDGRIEAWIAVIPEPAAMPLLGAGLMFILRWRRGSR